MFELSPTPAKDHPKKPQIKASAEALLRYIEADCHGSIFRSNKFETLVNTLKEALE